jgi:hypothetical protein
MAIQVDSCTLTLGPAYDIHELLDFPALIALVAGRDGMLDTMRDVVAQYLLLDAPQSRPDGRYLRDDVDAISIFPDHAGNAADLPFDSIQSFRAGRLAVVSHDVHIPPCGIACNTADRRIVIPAAGCTAAAGSGSIIPPPLA